MKVMTPSKTPRVLAVAALVLTAALAAAESPVGQITYMEGMPEIVRDGDLVFDTLDFGFFIENYDAVRTGIDSTVDFQLDPATGIDASITVEPDTEFVVNISALRSEQTGTIELVSGSISVVARKLVGRSRLQIRINDTIAGVRGTTFAVTTAVDGGVLIIAEEGSVEVSDEQGTSVFAVPGEAVEIDPEHRVFRNMKYTGVPASDFRQDWTQGRLERFRSNAPQIFRFYARRYFDARTEFSAGYEELMRHRAIIDQWIEESRRGGTGDLASVIQEKRQIAASLLRVRPSMAVLSETFARMDQMKPYIAAFASTIDLEDLGTVNTRRIRTAADFYRMLEMDRGVMERRIATVRHVLKLYTARNDGISPTPALEETPESGDDS